MRLNDLINEVLDLYSEYTYRNELPHVDDDTGEIIDRDALQDYLEELLGLHDQETEQDL